MELSILSYNVLADCYIRPSYYPRVRASDLAPERRLPLVREHVRRNAADVTCLQEVESRLFDLLEDDLRPLGFRAYYAQKHDRPEGCATFVGRKASGVRAERLYFHDGRDAGDDSGHVALLVVASVAGDEVGIANTHLTWDPPGTPRDEQWGYRQARALLSRLRSPDLVDTPWVVCGDLNAEATGERILLFKEAGFVDAYGRGERMYTCASNGRAKRIDYVLHVGALASTPRDLTPVADDTPLPNEDEPSDHIAIGATIRVRGD